MTKTVRSVLMFLLVAIASNLTPAQGAEAAATKKLAGTYTMDNDGSKGAVTAVFEPASDGQWKVTFVVKGGTDPYTGTAEGQVCQGQVAGRAVLGTEAPPTFTFNNDFSGGALGQRQEVFTFKGEFKDGRFVGTHGRIVDGKEEKVGTLNLGPPS